MGAASAYSGGYSSSGNRLVCYYGGATGGCADTSSSRIRCRNGLSRSGIHRRFCWLVWHGRLRIRCGTGGYAIGTGGFRLRGAFFDLQRDAFAASFYFLMKRAAIRMGIASPCAICGGNGLLLGGVSVGVHGLPTPAVGAHTVKVVLGDPASRCAPCRKQRSWWQSPPARRG